MTTAMACAGRADTGLPGPPHHRAWRRGQHPELLSARPAPLRRTPDRSRHRRSARGRRDRCQRLPDRPAQGRPGQRHRPRCRRCPRPAPSSRCAGCTASSPPRASSRSTWRGRQTTHPEPAAAQEPDPRRSGLPAGGAPVATANPTGPSPCVTVRCWRSCTRPAPGSRRPSGWTSTMWTPTPGSVLLRGKGGKQRLVPIGRPAVSALDDYLVRGRPDLARRGKGTPAIFLNARGGRLSRQSAWQVLQDSAEAAGIASAVSPHTMRALVRHPSARRRCRRARRAGTAGTRLGDHHADLHAGDGERAA